jgi:hypothetical protein
VTPAEAALTIRDAMKDDPDLRRAVQVMVERSGSADVFDWVDEHPDMALALADQVKDVDGQIANMTERLAHGDLS